MSSGCPSLGEAGQAPGSSHKLQGPTVADISTSQAPAAQQPPRLGKRINITHPFDAVGGTLSQAPYLMSPKTADTARRGSNNILV